MSLEKHTQNSVLWYWYCLHSTSLFLKRSNHRNQLEFLVQVLYMAMNVYIQWKCE